jgi:hypothetical protein
LPCACFSGNFTNGLLSSPLSPGPVYSLRCLLDCSS